MTSPIYTFAFPTKSLLKICVCRRQQERLVNYKKVWKTTLICIIVVTRAETPAQLLDLCVIKSHVETEITAGGVLELNWQLAITEYAD